jgi:hypothetical protein
VIREGSRRRCDEQLVKPLLRKNRAQRFAKTFILSPLGLRRLLQSPSAMATVPTATAIDLFVPSCSRPLRHAATWHPTDPPGISRTNLYGRVAVRIARVNIPVDTAARSSPICDSGVKLIRSLADKADPFIKVRRIELAERYERGLRVWSRAVSANKTPHNPLTGSIRQ